LHFVGCTLDINSEADCNPLPSQHQVNASSYIRASLDPSRRLSLCEISLHIPQVVSNTAFEAASFDNHIDYFCAIELEQNARTLFFVRLPDR
jgi:hypothetical protein